MTARPWYTTSADLDVVAMFACLQFRFNQLSIVIRHYLVMSTVHGVPFEVSVPQVLLHAVRKSYNQRKVFCKKRANEMIIIFRWASVLAHSLYSPL